MKGGDIMSLVVNGQVFDIELDEEKVVKEASVIKVKPCYVPGNFPWKAYNL